MPRGASEKALICQHELRPLSRAGGKRFYLCTKCERLFRWTQFRTPPKKPGQAMPGFEQVKEAFFACPDCDAVSFNPNDIREGYCGRCKAFTGPGKIRGDR